MSTAKDYSGDRVVRHVVQRGETLTTISRAYGLGSWSPIWKFNTECRAILKGGNPDQIPVGVVIYIPRSRASYDAAIKNLSALLANADDILLLARLDVLEAEAGKFGVVLDGVSSVLTLFASLATKAGEAVATANASQKVAASEGARWYVFELLDEAKDDVAGVTDDLVACIRSAGDAISRGANKKLVEKVVGLFPGGKEAILGKSLVGEGVALWSMLKAGDVRGAKLFLRYAEAAAQAGKGFLDYFEYSKPSKIATVWMSRVMGESLDDTLRIQRDRIKATVQRDTSTITARIRALKAERDAVWGK